MSVNVVFNGVTYPVPVQGDRNWAPPLTRYLVALGNGVIQTTGGMFTLTGDLNFGPNFGLFAKYFTSITTTPATVGFLRLAKTDTIEWRNNANSADNILAVNSSNQLTFNGNPVASIALPVIVSNGGTGDTSLTPYALLTGGTTSTNPVQSVASVGTTGQLLTSNGASALPTWQTAPNGAVNAGTANQMAYYATTGSAISGTSNLQTLTGNVFINDNIMFHLGVGTSYSNAFLLTEDSFAYLGSFTTAGGGPVDYKGWSDYTVFNGANASTFESFNARPISNGSFNVGFIAGLASTPTHNSTGTCDFLYGLTTSCIQQGGLVGNYIGLKVNDIDLASGAVTTGYGLYIDTLVNAGTNWAVYTNGTTQSHFGGKVNLDSSIGNAIHGTNTNDSASTGYVGEYIETITSFPTNFPTTNAWGDAATITLSAGDWDVTLNILVSAKSAATTTDIEFGISKTTGNSTTGLVLGSNWLTMPSPAGTSTNDTCGTVANYRQSLSSTTPIYAKILAGYTGTTPTFGCRLSARRIR